MTGSIQTPVKQDAQTQLAFQQLQSRITALEKQLKSSSAPTQVAQNTSNITAIQEELNLLQSQVNELLAGDLLAPLKLLFKSVVALPAYVPVYEADPGSVMSSSANTDDQTAAFAGVSGAASTAAGIEVIVFGDLVNPAWTWTATPGLWNPVYLAADGSLTQTPSRFIVGAAVTPTTLFVNPQAIGSVSTEYPIHGDGSPADPVALSIDETLEATSAGLRVVYGDTANSAAEGNDPRLNVQYAIKTVTVNYGVQDSDGTVLADTSGGAITLLLPSTPLPGMPFRAKKIDGSSNHVTLDGNGHDIDGAGTLVLTTQWQFVGIQYDPVSAAWYILSS